MKMTTAAECYESSVLFKACTRSFGRWGRSLLFFFIMLLLCRASNIDNPSHSSTGQLNVECDGFQHTLHAEASSDGIVEGKKGEPVLV